MSDSTSQDNLIDIDLLLEELHNLPPPAQVLEYFTETGPGKAYLTQELKSIYSAFIGVFLKPEISSYMDAYSRLSTIIGLGLRSAENRKQIVENLDLAVVVFENFVSVSLRLEHLRAPEGGFPSHTFVRMFLLDLVHQCLASPEYTSDITAHLQRLKRQIEEHEEIAMHRAIIDTKMMLDLWETNPPLMTFDFDSDPWLSEDIPDAALDIVAQGLYTVPTLNEIHAPSPISTAKLARRSSAILDAKLHVAKTRPLGPSQSLNVLPVSDSRPKKVLPKRGVSISRTKSLSAVLPREVQNRLITALDSVAEVEE